MLDHRQGPPSVAVDDHGHIAVPLAHRSGHPKRSWQLCVLFHEGRTRQLVSLGSRLDERRNPGQPTDISWWADFEQRHLRTAPRRNGSGRSRFGFFGVNSATFADIVEGAEHEGRYKNGTPACDCTD